jgi:hypothetical protein
VTDDQARADFIKDGGDPDEIAALEEFFGVKHP